MLNVIDNTFTKIWQKLLLKVAQATISWNQTGFLPGELIHHSMMLCNEVVNHILRENIATILLQIDFRKAYDTIRCDFLVGILKAMGFPQEFLNVVEAITRGASSQVLINGTRGEAFSICRSV